MTDLDLETVAPADPPSYYHEEAWIQAYDASAVAPIRNVLYYGLVSEKAVTVADKDSSDPGRIRHGRKWAVAAFLGAETYIQMSPWKSEGAEAKASLLTLVARLQQPPTGEDYSLKRVDLPPVPKDPDEALLHFEPVVQDPGLVPGAPEDPETEGTESALVAGDR